MQQINNSASKRKRFTLAIEYQVTEDLPNGTLWPPDGADFWSVVVRCSGFTRWRQIYLTKQSDVVALGGGLQSNSVRKRKTGQ